MSRVAVRHWLAAALLLSACANRQGPQTQRQPDGSYRITCDGALTNCLRRAEDVCKATPYEVLRARDQRERYGSEPGSAQTEVRSSEAIIRCSYAGRPFSEDQPMVVDNPPTRALPPTDPPPARLCVPGSTQSCTGPGACPGGQACLPGGTGFGPCDCGPLPAPPAATLQPAAAGAGGSPGAGSGWGAGTGGGAHSSSGGGRSAGVLAPPPSPKPSAFPPPKPPLAPPRPSP